MRCNTASPTLRPFTQSQVQDKELVLQLLYYEDELIHSPQTIEKYRMRTYDAFKSLTIEYAIQRSVLRHFGFDTSDESVSTYRTIFHYYYNTPEDYDKDVIGAVTYMRENKCIFYSSPQLSIGDCAAEALKACHVHDINGASVDLHHYVTSMAHNQVLVGAFSSS